jgi:hypothetical protein
MARQEKGKLEICDAAGVLVDVFTSVIVVGPYAASVQFMKVFQDKKAGKVFIIAFGIRPDDSTGIDIDTVQGNENQHDVKGGQ